MFPLERSLYRLVLRLHPADFRKQFARDMALDFDDALHTYGAARLWLDLLRSLARQWAAQLISVGTQPIAAPTASLLAGHYVMVRDEALSPLELARGFFVSITVLSLCVLALQYRPGHIPNLPVAYPFPSDSASAQASGSAQPNAFTTQSTSQIHFGSNAKAVPGSTLSEVPAVEAAQATAPILVTSGRPLEFDVVSIHEDKSDPTPQSPPGFGVTPNGYHLKNLPLIFLIRTAYIPSQTGDKTIFSLKQITGLPDWLKNINYDIDAKVSEADLANWHDPTLQPWMLRTMLQNMLAERFGLVAHRAMKEFPVFEMTVAKGGPKFKPSEITSFDEVKHKYPDATTSIGGTPVVLGPGPGQFTLFDVSMPTFASLMSNMAGRPIQDKTGLTGRYDIIYRLAPPPPPPPPQAGVNAATAPDPEFQILDIMDKLGLKLQPAKGEVETLTIDHIEKPSEN